LAFTAAANPFLRAPTAFTTAEWIFLNFGHG
jgi:hypothetical protein